MHRFRGLARRGGEELGWSVVLKVLQPVSEEFLAVNASRASVGARARLLEALRWDREALAYGSGLLAGLRGGLRAPTGLGVEPDGDGSIRLWTEDLGDGGGPWTLDDFGRAARGIGLFGGGHLGVVDELVARHAWLSRDWLRAYVEAIAVGGAAVVHDAARWRSPLARRAHRPDAAARVARLWAGRERLLAMLDALPATLCHHDLHHRGNLFRMPDGIAAVDWNFVGPGPLGQDLSQLVWTALATMAVEVGQARELEGVVLAGYVEGLRAAGWRDDPAAIRRAYAASLCLRYGMQVPQLNLMGDPTRHAAAAERFGRPIDEVAAHYGGITGYILDLADELLG